MLLQPGNDALISSSRVSTIFTLMKREEIYQPSAYTEPSADWGIRNSSNGDELHISNCVGDSFSGFLITRSLEPDGKGAVIYTPVISTGNGAHWKFTLLLLSFEILVDNINFLFLFAKIFGWLIENIAWEPIPAAKSFKKQHRDLR
ncbi:uncharacterized protein LOC108473784 [Gossypium arboreum]|uniref:uncharacterized protein LOC108473784 n=1 Tax=Gossypium arboreum TaxID=29729 RepID=UPI00081950BF|nr:uncharacterized protein LOC108473784 [Gossypium arboreum]